MLAATNEVHGHSHLTRCCGKKVAAPSQLLTYLGQHGTITNKLSLPFPSVSQRPANIKNRHHGVLLLFCIISLICQAVPFSKDA